MCKNSINNKGDKFKKAKVCTWGKIMQKKHEVANLNLECLYGISFDYTLKY